MATVASLAGTKAALVLMSRYHGAANRRIITAIRDASTRHAADSPSASPNLENLPDGSFFESMHSTVSHLAGADDLWYQRITSGDSSSYNYLYDDKTPAAAWGSLFTSFDAAAAALEERSERWVAFVDSLDDSTDDRGVDQMIHFSDTSNNPVSRHLALALLHVFNHGTHHRGQLHAALTSISGGKYRAFAPVLDLPAVVSWPLIKS